MCHSTERKHICPICSKSFKILSHLNRHKETHLDINECKHFECEFCQKKFRKNWKLKEHLRIHTGEKPYKCDQCDYSAALLGNLRKHQRTVHANTNPTSEEIIMVQDGDENGIIIEEDDFEHIDTSIANEPEIKKSLNNQEVKFDDDTLQEVKTADSKEIETIGGHG